MVSAHNPQHKPASFSTITPTTTPLKPRMTTIRGLKQLWGLPQCVCVCVFECIISLCRCNKGWLCWTARKVPFGTASPYSHSVNANGSLLLLLLFLHCAYMFLCFIPLFHLHFSPSDNMLYGKVVVRSPLTLTHISTNDRDFALCIIRCYVHHVHIYVLCLCVKVGW